ncbi:proton-conducting transporter transmembrane domain-containing protein [Candidatus Cytomitobacter indipagum]|nr:proton-conducting transporter membrane subunit [Candidatus Cytomitobacter indipagum]
MQLINFDPRIIKIMPNNIGIFIALSASALTSLAILCSPNLSIGFLANLYGIYKITCTTDFFNMYVGYEIVLIGFLFCLIKSGFSQWKQYLKYQMMASFIIVFGVALFYLEQGHLIIFSQQKPFISSYVMLIGFLIKCGIYPFGLWISLYKNMPNYISFWASGIITKISLYSILILMPWIRMDALPFKQINILEILSIISSIFGSILAYQSRENRKILSFHIMSQIGILLNIAIFEFCFFDKSGNFYLTKLYLLHHIWTKSTLFLMEDCKKSWILKYAALSLVGAPLTPGFLAKFSALYFMISKQYYLGAINLIFSSLITAFSMEKFLNKNTYRLNYMKESGQKINNINFKNKVSIASLLAHAILILGLMKAFI